jgi:hypothetical protein
MNQARHHNVAGKEQAEIIGGRLCRCRRRTLERGSGDD